MKYVMLRLSIIQSNIFQEFKCGKSRLIVHINVACPVRFLPGSSAAVQSFRPCADHIQLLVEP